MAFAGYPGMSGGFGAQPQMQQQQQQQPQFQPPVPQFQPQMMQQPQYYNPYGYGFPAAGMPPAAVSDQYHNSGTETIQGDTVQTGTFKGHGTGARIQGGFTASGNIL